MKNIRLGVKIGSSFALLTMITALFGGIVMYAMQSVSKQSEKLNHETTPQVEISNQLERDVVMAMYNMHVFTLTSDDKYFDTSLWYSNEIEKVLLSATDLSSKYVGLSKMKERIKLFKSELAEYNSLTTKARTLIEAIGVIRATMDQATQTCERNCSAYLDWQIARLNDEMSARGSRSEEIQSRIDKIQRINSIISLVGSINIANYKGQTKRDPKTMLGVMKYFIDIEDTFEELTTKTKTDHALGILAEARSSTEEYKKSVQDYVKAWLELTSVNEKLNLAADAMLAEAKAASQEGVEDTRAVTAQTSEELAVAVKMVAGGLVAALVICVVVAWSSRGGSPSL